MGSQVFSAWAAAEWTAFGTLVYAGVAVVAAGFAFLQVRESRQTRQDKARPFVIVDIQPGEAWSNLLDLVIENIGPTAAMDVRIVFDPPLKQARADAGYPIGESALIKEGIKMLPPGRCLRVFFDTAHERLGSQLPQRYDVTVSLKDARGRRQPDQRYTIDLAYMYGVSQTRVYGVHDAAKAITEIQKSVKRWSDIHGRLKVWVRDEDRRIQDEAVHRDLTGEWPSMGSPSPSELTMAVGRNVLVRSGLRRFRDWRRAREGQTPGG